MKVGLVSIAIPVYNVEKYLEECINSIINQTYKKIEVILVNDGSTDSSLDICKRFLFDDRIIIIDKKNEGLSIARQVAIDKANGEYLCIIDSDDFIENDFIEKLYLSIWKQGSDIALCASCFFTESHKKVNGFSKWVSPYKEISKYDIENNYSNLLMQYYMADSWAKIYNLSFIRQSNIRFSLSKAFNGTDLLFNYLLMLSMPKVSIINNVLYNHRMHADSRVHRKDKKMQEGFQIIMNAILTKSEEFNFLPSINNQFSIIYSNFMLLSAQDIVNSESSFIKIKDKLEKFHKMNKNYLMKEDRIKLLTSVHDKITSKVFTLLLKYNSLLFLYIYLRLRQIRLHNPNKIIVLSCFRWGDKRGQAEL